MEAKQYYQGITNVTLAILESDIQHKSVASPFHAIGLIEVTRGSIEYGMFSDDSAGIHYFEAVEMLLSILLENSKASKDNDKIQHVEQLLEKTKDKLAARKLLVN